MTSFLERWNAAVERLRAARDAVEAERKAADQAERERQETAQCAATIRPSVDATLVAEAKGQATPLFGLLRRWQDALAKYEAVSREVNAWIVPRCETDADLERAVALRNELRAEMNRFTVDGRKRLAEKVTELNAVIDDAKSRGLYSLSEPRFQTRTLFSGFHANYVRPTGRNRRQYVLPLSTLEANDPKAAERIAALFNASGIRLFPSEHGSAIVLEPAETRVGNGPFRSEFGPPDKATIDGLEIVKDTRRATEWYQEQEAERQREETARQESEREAARRERERKIAEFRELLAEAQQQPITENA